MTHDESPSVYEPARRTPVVGRYDVAVAGGGPAGVAAALGAAREGARVILVERFGMLGGVWTAGLLNPLFDAQGKGWLVAELIDRLQAAEAWRRWKFTATFDTEVMKLLLETLLTEAGVELVYYTHVADAVVEGTTVRGLILEGKAGRQAVLAGVVIDCTGDGDVAARAGAAFDIGRESDGLCQPMTLMFAVDGVGGYDQPDTFTLYDQIERVVADRMPHVRQPYGRVNYAPWVIHVPGEGGAAVVQATHVYRVDATDPRALTRGTIEARRQVHDLLTAMRHVPGLEGIRLTQTAPAIGVREARRVNGDYRLDLSDLEAGRRFDDAVTFCTFCVDVHHLHPDDDNPAHHRPMRPYEIPYRCLLPRGIEGLLVAGRCISGSHEAHASYRVTGTCMAMGQAAGLAAARAASAGVTPRQVDAVNLRRLLEARGAGFLPAEPAAASRTPS